MNVVSSPLRAIEGSETDPLLDFVTEQGLKAGTTVSPEVPPSATSAPPKPTERQEPTTPQSTSPSQLWGVLAALMVAAGLAFSYTRGVPFNAAPPRSA